MSNFAMYVFEQTKHGAVARERAIRAGAVRMSKMRLSGSLKGRVCLPEAGFPWFIFGGVRHIFAGGCQIFGGVHISPSYFWRSPDLANPACAIPAFTAARGYTPQR